MRKRVWIVAVLLGLALDFSYADAKDLSGKFSSIQYGMSKEQVLDILGTFSIFGKPYKVESHPSGDVYIWSDKSGTLEVQFTSGAPVVIRKTFRRNKDYKESKCMNCTNRC